MNEEGMPERRQGVIEFGEAIREASRDIRKSVEEQIRAHANESREAIQDLHATVRMNAETAKEIGDIVKPIPAHLAKIDEKLENHERENHTQWQHITEAKDRARDLEVQLAEERGRTQAATTTPSTSSGFWTGMNGRLLIVLGIFIVVGLIGLAGYNVVSETKDVLPNLGDAP